MRHQSSENAPRNQDCSGSYALFSRVPTPVSRLLRNVCVCPRANHFINSREASALRSITNSFDLILSTVNADLDWSAYIACLRPKGRLHFVGVAPSPISAQVFSLIPGQKSISGSPVGSPATVNQMLDFAARHKIEPITEMFAFDQINEALERLHTNKARYRIVLKH